MSVAARKRMPVKCTVDGLQLYETCGLNIESLDIAMPRQKVDTEDVFGMNGEYDFSEIDGFVTYEPRKIKMSLGVKTENRQKWRDNIESSGVLVKLSGGRHRIVFADDPDYYYEGRFAITDYKPYALVPKIKVEIDAHPFKRANTNGSLNKQMFTTAIFTSNFATLDSNRTTCEETNTYYNSGNTREFRIRGSEGKISVWRVPVTANQRYAFHAELGSNIMKQYGGYYEIRNSDWELLNKADFQTTQNYVFLVFVSEYTVTYTWQNPVLIPLYNETASFMIQNGDEAVVPYITATGNCLLVANGKIVQITGDNVKRQYINTQLKPGTNQLVFVQKGTTGTPGTVGGTVNTRATVEWERGML